MRMGWPVSIQDISYVYGLLTCPTQVWESHVHMGHPYAWATHMHMRQNWFLWSRFVSTKYSGALLLNCKWTFGYMLNVKFRFCNWMFGFIIIKTFSFGNWTFSGHCQSTITTEYFMTIEPTYLLQSNNYLVKSESLQLNIQLHKIFNAVHCID